jgi:hypothetical protein
MLFQRVYERNTTVGENSRLGNTGLWQYFKALAAWGNANRS